MEKCSANEKLLSVVLLFLFFCRVFAPPPGQQYAKSLENGFGMVWQRFNKPNLKPEWFEMFGARTLSKNVVTM